MVVKSKIEWTDTTRPDKIDGHYLPELSNLPPVFNSWVDR